MHTTVDLRVDGQPADPDRFAMPPMSLSSAREGMRAHRFALTIAADDLVALMSDEYDTLVEELEADDRLVGDEDELAAAGYPPLAELVVRPALMRLVFGRYLVQAFLSKVTWTRKGDIDYWAHDVDGCAIDSSRITFHGRCYSGRANIINA